MAKDFVKEAEESILENIVALENALKFVQAMHTFGNKHFPQYQCTYRDQYFESLTKIRVSLFELYEHKIATAFNFSGVCEGIKDKSIAKLKESFGETERFAVMHFLDQYGHLPSTWKTEDEKGFRDQVKGKIGEHTGKKKCLPKSKSQE